MRIYRQTDGFSCGPRAMQVALSHFDMFPPYKEISSLCETDEGGTDVNKMKEVAESYGLKTRAFTDSASPENIKKYTDKGFPVIVMWYVGDNSAHVAVAYNVDDNFVYLLDPSLHMYTEPTILIRRSMLKRCWKAHEDSQWALALYL